LKSMLMEKGGFSNGERGLPLSCLCGYMGGCFRLCTDYAAETEEVAAAN